MGVSWQRHDQAKSRTLAALERERQRQEITEMILTVLCVPLAFVFLYLLLTTASWIGGY